MLKLVSRPPQQQTTTLNSPPSNNTMTNAIVLVVDDSADTLQLINDSLEQAGINVLVALEGKQALTIAKRLRPDMILLDAIMPNMDGFEVCRRLKQDPHLASIPVIFMTGLSDTEYIVQGLDVGGVDYLTKPINPNELLARMKVHLTNARLTHSVHQALDATGQLYFTVNKNGEILWATPQTQALFAMANATDTWQKTELSRQICTWLQRSNHANQTLNITNLDYPLAVQLIEQRDTETTLLKLIDSPQPAEQRLAQKLQLTQRESQALFWVAKGKTNREIGEILEVSPRTVNKHLEQLFPKLGVENRTAAAGIAIRALN